uniref:O-fucosyltransferase family protein n=1 Tax=Chenopodium quinoa TaxID=63459 RepID=A0A803NEE2_CHEQI
MFARIFGKPKEGTSAVATLDKLSESFGQELLEWICAPKFESLLGLSNDNFDATSVPQWWLGRLKRSLDDDVPPEQAEAPRTTRQYEDNAAFGQQITDFVAVVRILDVTLVVSLLDHNSYCKDDSDFADIFYVDWFISSLAKDVKIVKKFPNKITRSMEKPPYTMRVPRKSNLEDYIELFAYGAYLVYSFTFLIPVLQLPQMVGY